MSAKLDYLTMGVQKYWSPTSSSMTPEQKRQRLEIMAAGGQYIWSEKYDGNFSRAVITPERSALQTRGISKKTGTYGEVQNKVFFWDDVVNAFDADTVILGEIYMPGGIDATVGSILRCLDDKALARQKDQKLEWRIFDVLVLDGYDMIDRPIEERIVYIPEVVRRINNPLVKGIEYHEMNSDFFTDLQAIFARDGEGIVCYKKGVPYTPGKRTSAWNTVKVKREIEDTIDCFITKAVEGEYLYNGKELENWQFWQDNHTGEKLLGNYYIPYTEGKPLTPLTRNAYYNWPAAVEVGVYDKDGNIVTLCKISNLTDEMKASLRDYFKSKWYMCPVSIGGMMVSEAHKVDETGLGISVRHPYLKSVRAGDINPEDCTLEKILL